MKKNKIEKPVVPISLSSKKTLSRHEQLFTPYKIDWKGTPLESVDNQNSKAFFQSMKNELSSIKNDVQKLIRKDSACKDQNSVICSSKSSYVKSKCQNVVKKSEKNLSDKADFDLKDGNKEFKDINEAIERDKSVTFDKSFYSDKFMMEGRSSIIPKTNGENIEYRKYNDHTQSNKKPINSYRDHENITLTSYKKTDPLIREENDERVQNRKKQVCNSCKLHLNTIQSLTNQIKNFQELQMILSDQKLKVKSLQQLCHNTEKQKKSKQQQFNEHKYQLMEQIKQINISNQEFQQQKNDTEVKLVKLSKNNENLNQQIEQIKTQWNQKQTQYCRKIQYLKQQIKQYENRENICAAQWKIQQSSKQSNNSELKNILQQKEQQILILKKQIQELQNKQKREVSNTNIKTLGEQFEAKINSYVDQVYQLKNRITHLTADRDQLKLCVQNLKEEIQIYEQRQKQRNSDGKAMKATEWQQMKDQIDRLTLQNKNLVSYYELQIMELQNKIDQIKQDKKKEVQDENEIKILFKQQIQENNSILNQLREEKKNNQKYKKQNLEFKALIETMEAQVTVSRQIIINNQASNDKNGIFNPGDQLGGYSTDQISRLRKDIGQIIRKQSIFEGILNEKTKEILIKNQFIKKVLIAKAMKTPEQNQIDYYMQKIQKFIPTSQII